jgi:hypothetical protein
MQPMRWSLLMLLPGLVPALVADAADKVAAKQPVNTESLTFERHVRPIFKVHCIHCHGEGSEREGGLDLRLQRFMVSGGESGPAIEPGKPKQSLLLQKLVDGEMPPGDKRLPAAELATIERWIAEGAKTARPEPATLTAENSFTEEEREYWAFQPIRRPPVPQIGDASRVRTPIDVFILQRLAEKQLTLSPEADRQTLVRRAFFDLLGLPPTPAEVDAFLADSAPDAYERLIDRLLARPEYGERWGRHWLDVAGYADSDGYTPEDPVREYAYKYRDYVIQSFNADRPFDEFIRQQLAGDELAGPSLKNMPPEQVEKLVATGFLRMAADGTGVGSVDAKVARNQVIADTLKIVSTSLLGMTVGCAECHDHKYDPISQVDYYRLRAVFEPALDWSSWRAPRARLVSLATDADLKKAAEINAEAAKIDAERAKLLQTLIDKTFAEELQRLPENVRQPLREAFQAPLAKRTAAQKKLLAEYPSVNVTGSSLYLFDRPRQNAVASAKAKRAQREKQLIQALVDKRLQTAPTEKRSALRVAFVTAEVKRTAEQKKLLKTFPAATVDAATLLKESPEAAKELTALDVEIVRLQGEIAIDQVNKLTDQAAAIRARKPKEDFVQALTEIPGRVPVTHVFHRGDFAQPKQAVEPGEPLILSMLAQSKSPAIPVKDKSRPTTGRRLALANRLTDGTHPLVARVLVNRLWLHHFGRGIVGTPTDFGLLGERPTHPELLDWLAAEFMSGGWRMKPMHKLLMTSSVYRQTSRATPAQIAVDPDNRLLSRMNILRAEAETIRDSILAVSGKLSSKRFGPPVPVTPDEVGQVVIGVDTRDSAGRPTSKTVSLGDDVFRRSIYVQVRRSQPLSMLETFDAPTMTSNCNCEIRSNSTVAPQSLILMNSEFLVEQAGLFAARLQATAKEPAAEIDLAWKLAFARAPSDSERTGALAFLQSQATSFQSNKLNADKSVASNPQSRALTTLCQALFSSNEFLYID